MIKKLKKWIEEKRPLKQKQLSKISKVIQDKTSRIWKRDWISGERSKWNKT